MSDQSIGDLYFMQKRLVFLCDGPANLECFADRMQFPKKFFEKPQHSGKYDRMSPHAVME